MQSAHPSGFSFRHWYCPGSCTLSCCTLSNSSAALRVLARRKVPAAARMDMIHGALWEVKGSKAAADAALRRQNYRDAWQLYTRALEGLQDSTGASPGLTKEARQLRRNILSNRCAAYTAAGRTHEALIDAQQLQQDWPPWSKSWFRGARACEAAKQYTVALQQYAQAWRLEQPDGQWEVQRHMLRAVAQLTTPQLADVLLGLMLGQEPTAHTAPSPTNLHSYSEEDSTTTPGSFKLVTTLNSHSKLSLPAARTSNGNAVQGAGGMLRSMLSAAGIPDAELQEAGYQLTKRLCGEGTTRGFPHIQKRVVSWVCDGKPPAMDHALMAAQLLCQLQCWDASSVCAHQAVCEARLQLLSQQPCTEAAIDQLAYCYSVLGSALLKHTLQLHDKLGTLPAYIYPVSTDQDTAALSWKILYQHALVCLAAAAQLCPGRAEYQAALNTDQVHLLGGEVAWGAKQWASSGVLQLASKYKAVQQQQAAYELEDAVTPQPQAAATIAASDAGNPETGSMSMHNAAGTHQAAVQVEQAVGDQRTSALGRAARDGRTGQAQLVLSLVLPAATRGGLTGTARTQLLTATRAALEHVLADLSLQGCISCDSTGVRFHDAGVRSDQADEGTRYLSSADSQVQGAAGGLNRMLECQFSIRVLLEGVKQSRSTGKCPLHISLRAVVGVKRNNNAVDGANRHDTLKTQVLQQLLQHAADAKLVPLLAQHMQCSDLTSLHHLGLGSTDESRCRLLPSSSHAGAKMLGTADPTMLLGLDPAPKVVGTLLQHLQHASKSSTVALPHGQGSLASHNQQAAGQGVCSIKKHTDMAEAETAVVMTSAAGSAAAVCSAARQPVLQLPYAGYQLVDVWGRPMERPTKHPFALSRVFYAAEELPTDEKQVWFQPTDGTCRWRQTASEIIILATKVPVGIAAKRLNVNIQPYKLEVSDVLTGVVYLGGALERGVVCDESTWWCPTPSTITSDTSHPVTFHSHERCTATCEGCTAGCDVCTATRDWDGVPQAGAEYGAGCVLVLSKMNLELLRGGQPASAWWPRLMTHHAEVAWDDTHKDYSDLPQQLKDMHRAEEARAAAQDVQGSTAGNWDGSDTVQYPE